MSKRDYYDVLGVTKDVDSSSLKNLLKTSNAISSDKNPGDKNAKKF